MESKPRTWCESRVTSGFLEREKVRAIAADAPAVDSAGTHRAPRHREARSENRLNSIAAGLFFHIKIDIMFPIPGNRIATGEYTGSRLLDDEKTSDSGCFNRNKQLSITARCRPQRAGASAPVRLRQKGSSPQSMPAAFLARRQMAKRKGSSHLVATPHKLHRGRDQGAH